ncbi:hypothetical protein D9615_004947 [Tricholomella constricta]|uniref:Uncharacterized protein n=1 Tax=Tricholomella constricta TaxID=117010 RepID=A0A8H5HGD7_9AGAR|nr:hypothetical protein D9615_004947 [Tricholomella constricta]
MGECSSAKEVVIAIQEAMERLESALEGDDENDELDTQTLSCSTQLTILVELYAACLPRLKLRRKSASETIKPLLSELESVVRLSGSRSSCEEGRALISSVSHLVTRLEAWSKQLVTDDAVEISARKDYLKSLLDTTLDAYTSLEISPTTVLSAPSTPAMIIFAHSGSKVTQLPKLIPILVSSIQTGSALDEALTILLRALDPLQAPPRPYLPEEVIHPLFAVLSPLSSSHPDPLVRHQAYRILSTLLSSCPPPIRLRLLTELATDPDFPQMRVAAMGLVKEAVLEALTHPPNIFASPTFFDIFGPILFMPSPRDLLLDESLSIDSFKESSESARLVESLGTYYTILLRDKANLTRMRDPDALKWVQTALLTPLRQALNRWANQPETSGGEFNAFLKPYVPSAQAMVEHFQETGMVDSLCRARARIKIDDTL